MSVSWKKKVQLKQKQLGVGTFFTSEKVKKFEIIFIFAWYIGVNL